VQTTLTVLETVFLILSIVVVLAVVAAAVLLVLRIMSANRADRRDSDSDLQIVDLGKQLTERANRVRRSLMPKKERKEFAKRSKAEGSTENYDSTVFVIDFRPKLRAREVETLRKEVDVITQLVTPRDEVLVRIDSPGGTVTGYGHAASQLLRIHNRGVPLTICVDEIAASGGYMCAAVADKIIAAPFAFIGSIGVVAGIPNFVGLMNKLGVRYFELTAGENKRTLSPFSEPTPEKQAVEQQRLEAIHRAFKELIKKRRPNLDIDRVADGNYWLAVDAKELGLVDVIQTSDEYLLQQAKANRQILKISCERKGHRIVANLLDSFGGE
jgi:serine protease SohB